VHDFKCAAPASSSHPHGTAVPLEQVPEAHWPAASPTTRHPASLGPAELTGGNEPVEVNPVQYAFDGGNNDSDRCGEHAFLPLQGIRPMIETAPLANAAEAYGRMMRNEARFRIVQVTGQ